ncbi:hypothetical protein BY996DRAFT_6414416 [Phakopsora pachyrhizi]|nr:hypothetical protein BY996DRAFT_6414416 [Phakopsora pachyrhizi]
MNPSSIIMNNEIQEISGKEYKRNLEDARKVCFQVYCFNYHIGLFLILILLKYETTGEIPEDEQIQVLGPTISTTEELSRRLRKRPTPPEAQVPEANLDFPVMNALEGENSPPPRSSILEDVRIENYCANDTLECLENHGGDNGESAIEEANPLNLTIQKPPPNKTSAPIAQQTSTSAQSSTEITQCSKIVAIESILALNPHLTASSPPSNISANLVPPSTEENVNGNDDVLNIQSEQSQSIIGINIQKDTGGNLTILEQDPTFICPTKSKKDLTITVDPDLRIQLYKGFHFFQSGRASSQKYSKAWNSILNFVLWRLIPPNQTPNTISNFSFQESECSYDSWIKTIAKLAKAHAEFKGVTKKKKSKKNTSSLTTDSKDYWNASISDCMDFINSASLIHLQDTQSKTSEERIWKNVYTCIHQLLPPAFRHPDEIPKFQPPTIHQLAEAVATDFISHWTEISPDSTFVIPNKPSQITFE